MSGINTITTTQKIFTMRRVIIIRILISKNWMGCYKRLKETQIYVWIKIKRLINMQKKKTTLRI